VQERGLEEGFKAAVVNRRLMISRRGVQTKKGQQFKFLNKSSHSTRREGKGSREGEGPAISTSGEKLDRDRRSAKEEAKRLWSE